MLPRIMTVLILVATTVPVAAQSKERVPVRPTTKRSAHETFDVEFAGGTLETLFSAVWEQNQKTPNVAIAEDVKDMMVPPLQLTGISMLSLADTLQRICPGVYVEASDNIIGLYRPKESVYVSIYNVQHLVDQEDKILSYSWEDIATTIQTGWEMYNDSQDPEMKIHEGTFLIIVEGTKAEQMIVSSVLERLTRSDQGMMTNMNRLNSQLRRLKSDIKVLASQLSSLSKKMDELKKEKQALDLDQGPTMSK